MFGLSTATAGVSAQQAAFAGVWEGTTSAGNRLTLRVHTVRANGAVGSISAMLGERGGGVTLAGEAGTFTGARTLQFAKEATITPKMKFVFVMRMDRQVIDATAEVDNHVTTFVLARCTSTS